MKVKQNLLFFLIFIDVKNLFKIKTATRYSNDFSIRLSKMNDSNVIKTLLEELGGGFFFLFLFHLFFWQY